MASFFTPGTTLSVRARRALFESGNASTRVGNGPLNRHICSDDELSPEEMNDGTFQSVRLSSTSTVRKPLSFLSPSNKNNNRCNMNEETGKENCREFKNISMKLWSGERQNCKAENIATLKMEISQLQRQVQMLDEEKAHKEDREPENDNNVENRIQGQILSETETLMKLNGKLNEIQAGLLEIEDERENLFSKVKTLEREKYTIQLELSQREKEIISLSRRCTMQSDKTRNSALLQSVNKQLSRRIEDLQEEIHRNGEDNPTKEELQKKLQESEKICRNLERKLSDVCKDHEALSEKLRSCLDTCERLTEEKREWGKQRRQILEQANEEIEKQRLRHEEALSEYEAHFEVKSKQIFELDNKLIEKVSLIQKLQEELANLEEAQAQTVEIAIQEYERKLQEMKIAKQTELDELDSNSKIHLKHLEKLIDEKDRVILSLRKDVETHMEELMSSSSLLNEHRENSKLLESLTVDIETLEHERTTLRDELHEKETNIAELSAEILKLEIEKELLEQEIRKIVKMNENQKTLLQEKDTAIRTFEQQLRDCRLKSQELEATIRDTNKQHAAILEHTLSEHEKVMQKMNDEINGYKSALDQEQHSRSQSRSFQAKQISMLETQIHELQNEKAKAIKKFEFEISEVQNCNKKLELEVQRLTKIHADTVLKMSNDHNLLVSSLRMKLEELEKDSENEKKKWKDEVNSKDSIIDSLRQQVLKLSDDVVQKSDVARCEVSNVQRQLQKLKTQLAIKDDEIRELRVIELQDREDVITNLRNEISRVKEQAENQSKKSLDLIENLESQITLLQQNVSFLEQHKVENEKMRSTLREKMQKDVADIKRELDFAHITIKDLERKLSESTASQGSARSDLDTQRKDNVRLQCEIRELRLQNEAVAREYAVKSELERKELDEISSLKEKCELFRVDLLKAEKKIVAQQDQMAELEAIVQDRTETLSSIVELHKECENRLEESERRYNALEIKASNLQVEVMDCDSKLSLLRKEIRQNEDSYLDSLHEEQNLREIAENDLSNALKKIESLSIDRKELIELRKENQELKDKIHRQESFLQRKMNKDKVLRDRNVVSIPRYPTPNSRDATPSRNSTSSKLQQPTSRSKHSRSFSAGEATVVTASTMEETETLDFELNSLLAD